MKKDEHISILSDAFEKLKRICEAENRTKRGKITMMIDEEYKRLFGAKG
jgi:hypothetical protein